jgi:RimJ/RimL family protein N-acetyltransferase
MMLKEYQIEQFYPTFFMLKKHTANTLLYVFWFLMTFGKYKIIYLKKDDDIIHYTHILPKFFKLPFLGLNDLEIGPSWTKESYRGKGIFPAVINYTVQCFKEKGRNFYTFAHIDNISSQKAIIKAGFIMWGRGYKTDFLGIYNVEAV